MEERTAHQRIYVPVGIATITGLIGKAGFLYSQDHARGKDWGRLYDVQPWESMLLLLVFLVLFRLKMINDDAKYYSDLAAGKFKNDIGNRLVGEIGIFLGYLSWLLWAGVIFFFENRMLAVWILVASLGISTIWLVADIWTRLKIDKQRLYWIVTNILYGVTLLLITQPAWYGFAGKALLIILFLDWLGSFLIEKSD